MAGLSPHVSHYIPGKLGEARYNQLNVNYFVSLLLLSSTLFCDVSLVMWTTTKEKWAVYVVTSMRGKDPLAMAMFAIAAIPLIHQLKESSSANQVWFADDATTGEKQWWDELE